MISCVQRVDIFAMFLIYYLINIIINRIHKRKQPNDKWLVNINEIFKDYSQALPNDLVAYPDCISIEANIEDLCQVMKIDLNNVKPLNVLNRISKLKKLNLFKNLSEKTLELIARKLQKIKLLWSKTVGTIYQLFMLYNQILSWGY